MTRPPAIRCAIYTRKSSDEGLDQSFNSLDAQHEACAAYIASQRHEGWTCVPARYDDGGVSGGTLERPGLQRLLADIDAGLVAMVVVYKIDRLTRSLADFGRLVERLDAAGCSFVSVTQAFNTATSMGRLTLNVLLSFAQFEREVTAERIRDKIAASKKKGMWMCGTLPLGYDRHPDPLRRELVVNPAEAAQVHELFRLYDAHGCLGAVEQAAAGQGLRSKHQVFANGATRGGGPLSRGQIHYLLTNTTYLGLIRHREATYPGLHPAIIEADLWDRVQARLQASRARPRGERGRLARSAASAQARGGSPSEVDVVRRTTGGGARPADATAADAPLAGAPLMGKLRDETGDRLTPTHSVRRGQRRCYYTSARLLRGGAGTGAGRAADPRTSVAATAAGKAIQVVPDLGPRGWRLPADALESLVADAIAGHLEALADSCRLLAVPDIARTRLVSIRAGGLVARLRRSVAGEIGLAHRNSDLRALLKEGRLAAGCVSLTLDPVALAEALGVAPSDLPDDVLTLTVPFALRRRGIEMKLVAGDRVTTRAPDAALVHALTRAHRWVRAVRDGTSLVAIARSEGTSESFVRTRIGLAFLAPRLQEDILDGRQPPDLTLERLLEGSRLPDWAAQEAMLLTGTV